MGAYILRMQEKKNKALLIFKTLYVCGEYTKELIFVLIPQVLVKLLYHFQFRVSYVRLIGIPWVSPPDFLL